MMRRVPRVALFADSFHEVNGVGLTCRMFEDYARRRGYPMLSVHAGPRFEVTRHGSVTRCEIPSSRVGFTLEQDLRFDLLFLRHRPSVRQVLRDFAPDIVHITGPNHAGMLGALLAHEQRVTLAASWHTNVHEYAARRMARWMEPGALWLTQRYYALARLLFAPNPELAAMLSRGTGKPCRLMRRGVDTRLFTPQRRARRDPALVIGYVGRLSTEKSVRRLAEVERALQRAGISDFRIEVAGHGSERDWLHRNIARLVDHGVLRGEALARVYAGFDIFAFPSETDTYGNVVQEAMASGVPCVVMPRGGPAHIVRHGHDGLIAHNAVAFAPTVAALAKQPDARTRMGLAARQTAQQASWEAVFDSVYDAYLELEDGAGQRILPGPGLHRYVVADGLATGHSGGDR